MSTEVLAYIPSPSQGVWNLGPFPLRAYALCIIVGIVVAIFWGNRRWVARGGRDGEVLDVAIWAVPFGLIGGRIYHVATDWSTYFGDGPKSPMDALKIWDGGLGIWGAVAFGALGAWIGARRAGIKLPPFGDAIAPGILLAQAIGRLGNYFNQELYGDRTDLPWGLEIFERSDSSGFTSPGLIDGKSTGVVYAVVQPTFLYELLWNVLVVLALVYIDRRFRIGHGRLFALYVAGYCLGRFVIETLRTDTATLLWGIRINLFTAAIVFACAAIYVVIAPKGRETPAEIYHPGSGPDPALSEDPVDGFFEDEAPVATKTKPAKAATQTVEPETKLAGTSTETETRTDTGTKTDTGVKTETETKTEAKPAGAKPAEAKPAATEDKPAATEAKPAATEAKAAESADVDTEAPAGSKLDSAAKPYRKPKPDTATGGDDQSV
ncbi:prolipoprotein diacylglyceryl transferase [Williamsia limnetica]|uniref:Phosphatidylglycerol--prolipoprotein diacylglyceryl transferase n=1 Tax=Williamsia limnetica TaxID=882452 RepID=A0A318RG95_WILLI|nr:prolipoprotein diacylglyceryl transferase [Williamsia limnetica]